MRLRAICQHRRHHQNAFVIISCGRERNWELQCPRPCRQSRDREHGQGFPSHINGSGSACWTLVQLLPWCVADQVGSRIRLEHYCGAHGYRVEAPYNRRTGLICSAPRHRRKRLCRRKTGFRLTTCPRGISTLTLICGCQRPARRLSWAMAHRPTLTRVRPRFLSLATSSRAHLWQRPWFAMGRGRACFPFRLYQRRAE